MLDLSQLREQLESVPETQADTRELRRRQVNRAKAALHAIAPTWREVRKQVQQAQPRHLVADMRAAPTERHPPPRRPDTVTVVATDGSQIFPDRHVEPTYFLLNIGRVAFQYGTTESPVLDAVPDLRFPDNLDAHFDEVMATMTTEVVSALRDEQELRELLSLSRTARQSGRPIVALADGTLIRWMLRGMQNREVEQALIQRYTRMLQGFMDDDLPIGSYISMPGNTEVVNLLRHHLGELDDDPSGDGVSGERAPDVGDPPDNATNLETDPGMNPNTDGADVSLTGLLDRHVFAATLAPEERSAMFGSTSHIQREYPPGNEICYFYLHVPVSEHQTEIARVEVPAWVADRPEVVDLIHAVVLRECEKGGGYPLILSEAHERAVIRGPEREAFQHLLDRMLRRAGLPPTDSRKRRSKQRPKV